MNFSNGEEARNKDVTVGEIDRRRIRIGLAILVAVVAAALVASLVLEDPTAKTVMFAIIVFTLVRAYLFTRRLRRDPRPDDAG